MSRNFRSMSVAWLVSVFIAYYVPWAALAANVPPSAGVRPTLVFQVGHSDSVRDLAFTPETGEMLATASDDNTVRLWDTKTWKVLTVLSGHTENVNKVVYSPDKQSIATASDDFNVRIWDAHTGAIKAVFTGHKGEVKSLAFAPDGRTLASGSTDHTVRLWDMKSRRSTVLSHPDKIMALAFQPKTGSILATISEDYRARLWDVPRGKLLRTLEGAKDNTSSGDQHLDLAFSPDGQNLATTDLHRNKAELWSIPKGELRATFIVGQIFSLAFSPNGNYLAIGTWGGVQLWDTRVGQQQNPLTLEGEKSKHAGVLTFSPDGKRLAADINGNIARLWDLATKNSVATLQGHTGQILALDFSPDSKVLVSGSGDNSSLIWSAEDGTLLKTLEGRDGWVKEQTFSPDRRLFATGAGMGDLLADLSVKDKPFGIRVWDVAAGQNRGVLRGHTGAIFALEFSPIEGKVLASGSADGTARLWDVATGASLYSPLQFPSIVNVLSFSPDGKCVAVGSYDKTAKLWSVDTGKTTDLLEVRDVPRQFKFNSTGKVLAIGCDDEKVALWDTQTGQRKATVPGEHSQLPLFSPDDATLAVVRDKRTVEIWDANSLWANEAKQPQKMLSLDKDIRLLRFSSDNSTLCVTCFTNKEPKEPTVYLWNIRTGVRKTIPSIPSAHYHYAGFSKDGKTLGVVGDDRILRLWDVASAKPRPLKSSTQEDQFSVEIANPVSFQGAEVILHHPSGRVLAWLEPLPEIAQQVALDAKQLHISIGDKPIGGQNEWAVFTPEGYFDCSANALSLVSWQVGGTLYPGQRYIRRFRRPDLVAKALRGEPVPAPITQEDVPPTAHFVSLRYDPAHQDTVSVTIEARGQHDFQAQDKEPSVILLVNGRPLPPDNATPFVVSLTDQCAEPLNIIEKRPISIGDKPVVINEQPTAQKKSSPFAKRFVFQVPLPLGAQKIQLQSTAYDMTGLGSNPETIFLDRAGVAPIRGNLYVLCVGLSRYLNGVSHSAQSSLELGKGQFPNLAYADHDAEAISQRLEKEGQPLYQQVISYPGGPLVNERATLENVRAGLKWLQDQMRERGQIDTAVIFMSGHGFSDPRGSYYFPTHEFDLKDYAKTSLSGTELQDALGGKLRAKSVFLFVDSCYAGALPQARSDDLTFDVAPSGVYVLASSGAAQRSFEGSDWQHGIFTEALRRTLDNPQWARDGVFHFNELTYAVPAELAKLLKSIGASENAAEPVIPLAGRQVNEPIAQVRQ